MCAKMAFQHQAGTAMECLSVSNSKWSYYCILWVWPTCNTLLRLYPDWADLD